MGSNIVITKDNVDVFRGAAAALKSHLTKLVEMTKEYPVECSFAGYRFVFERETDIRELISALDGKLTAFDSAA